MTLPNQVVASYFSPLSWAWGVVCRVLWRRR